MRKLLIASFEEVNYLLHDFLFLLAREEGIEPSLTVLETAFLPLEDSPLYAKKEASLPSLPSDALRTLKTAYTSLTDPKELPGFRRSFLLVKPSSD